MNLPTLIVALVVAAVIAAIVVTGIRNRKRGKSACASCSGCAMGGAVREEK